MRSHMFSTLVVVALGCLGFAGVGHAGEASVLDVQVRANEDGTYAFTATVSHRDEGWSHYADKWEVLSPTGDILGTRILYPACGRAAVHPLIGPRRNSDRHHIGDGAGLR